MGTFHHSIYHHQVGIYHTLKKRFGFALLGLLSTLFLFLATGLISADAPDIEITSVSDISGPYAPDETVDATVDVTLTGPAQGTKWQSTKIVVDGDEICINTPNHSTAGDYSEDVSFTAPLTPDTYDVEFTAHKNGTCGGDGNTSDVFEASMTVEAVVSDPDPTDSHQFNVSGNIYRDVALNDCDNKSECENRAERLPDWEARLYKENPSGEWELIDTDITDANGKYKFATQYEAGIYHTCEVLKSGWIQQKQTWSGSGYKVETENLSGDLSEGQYCNTLAYDDTHDRSSKAHIGNVDTQKPQIIITDPASGAIVKQVLVDASIEDNYKLNYFNIELSKVGDPNWSFTTQKQNVSGQTNANIADFDLLEAAYYGTCDGHNPCATWSGGTELPDGEYKVRINAYDLAGNRQIYSHNFTIDNTPPDNLAFTYTEDSSGHEVSSGGYTDSEYFTFNLSADGEPSRWQLKYWNDIPGSPFKESSPWNPSDLSGWSTVPPTLGIYKDHYTQGEGMHYFSFSACDEHDNCSPYKTPFEITFDETPPKAPTNSQFYLGHSKNGSPIVCEEEGSPIYTNNDDVLIDWDPSASGDVEYYWFGIDNANNTKPYHKNSKDHPGEFIDSSTAYKVDITSPSNNPHSYTVIAVDKAGHESVILKTCEIILDQEAPNEPTADPAAGDYTGTQSVELSASDNGDSGLADIYYTTDGSTPDDSNTVYSGPIDITEDTTLKAIAYDNAGNPSSVLMAEYGIAPVISDETSTETTTTSVTIEWTTDQPATSRVVYDTVSQASLGSPPNYGYAESTIEDSTKVTSHSVTVTGLTSGETYFFRTVSHGSPESVSNEVEASTDSNPSSNPNNNSFNNNNSNDDDSSTSSFNAPPAFNTFGSLGAATATNTGNVLSDNDNNNNDGNEEGSDESGVQANSTGLSSATTAGEAATSSSWSWWWVLPIAAALLILFALLRRRDVEEEA